MTVRVVGAAAVTARGLDWRGLAGIVRGGAAFAPSRQLAESHPGTLASEIGEIPAERDAGTRRQRKLMSRAARLGAIAARDACADAGWLENTEDVGYYLGVGASGGPLSEIIGMFRVSLEDDRVSMAKLGAEGLRTSNPMFTFQVLNNFTMCHGAIACGTGGPNGAFFSRGTGTVSALAESVYALRSGGCTRALAGGADTALHPVTWCELVRDGRAAGGLVPGEGAGVLALAAGDGDALATVEACGAFKVRALGWDEALARARTTLGDAADVVVIAPWGDPPRERLREAANAWQPSEILDATAALGESLAATPALAWIAAVDALAGGAERAVVLTAGTDGDLGVAAFSRTGGVS